MRRMIFFLLLATLALPLFAQSVYVTDKLYLGLYAQPSNDAERLTVLHSGDQLEVLTTQNAWSQVRTADGTVGWAKSSYLVTQLPATLQLAAAQQQVAALSAQRDQLRQALEAARNTPAAQQADAAKKRSADLATALQTTRAALAGARAAKERAESDLAATKQKLAQAQEGPDMKVIAGTIVAGLLLLLAAFAAGARWHRNRLRARLGGLDI